MRVSMCREFLVPETAIHGQGSGEPVRCGSGESALVTLGILKVEEQESLQIVLYQSSDGASWEPQPFAEFSQKFYPGTHQIVIAPTAEWIQARWHVNRWGRGDMTPRFTFYVFIEPLT